MLNQEASPNKNTTTLGDLVDTIEFSKIKKKHTLSETESISSSHTVEGEFKEKSKMWTEQQMQLLRMLINKYGTDFHILSTFFPKKTKNQIKHRHKQIQAMKKKQQKQEKNNLQAISFLFKEAKMQEQEN